MKRHGNKHGDVLVEPIIKWAMLLLALVVFWMIAGQPLYGLVKDALGIVPDACGLERKSVRDYQEQLANLIRDEKIAEMERVYTEFIQCGFRQPLDDEIHFQIGKAGYDYHLKRYEYRRAPYILRDYVNRDPAGAHRQEALNLIQAADKLFKDSPTTKLAAAAELEGRDWQGAKRTYKQIIDDISGKPDEYRKAFTKESTQAHTRYIHIEADQFKDKDLRFTPSDAVIDAASGNLQYTLTFNGMGSSAPSPPATFSFSSSATSSPVITYTAEISTEQRTLGDPTGPLVLRLSRGGTTVPLRKEAGNLLDYEANSLTAGELLDRLQTTACAGGAGARSAAGVSTTSPASDAATPLPCGKTTILLGLTGKQTLSLPNPTAPAVQTDRVSFSKAPTLPLSLDPFLLSSYPSIDVMYRGKPYTMSLLIEKYPSTTATVAWSDRTHALGNTPEAHDLTFQSLLSLCPTERDIDPHADRAEEQLIRCLWKRQIFTPTYQPNLAIEETPHLGDRLGIGPDRLPAGTNPTPIERPPYSW